MNLDLNTIGFLLSIIGTFPVVHDLAAKILARKKLISRDIGKQIAELIQLVEEKDFPSLSELVDSFSKTCEQEGIPIDKTEERWKVSASLPKSKFIKIQRVQKQEQELCSTIEATLEGIMALIDCCTGVTLGRAEPIGGLLEIPAELRQLRTTYENLLDIAKSPEKHSISEITKNANNFINDSKALLKNLRSRLG